MTREFFSQYRYYFHTIKHLKPLQVYGQISTRLKKIKINHSPPPLQRLQNLPFTKSIHKSAQFLSPNKVIFINQSNDISHADCWSDNKQEKLWLYNLHYFDVLYSLLK